MNIDYLSYVKRYESRRLIENKNKSFNCNNMFEYEIWIEI